MKKKFNFHPRNANTMCVAPKYRLNGGTKYVGSDKVNYKSAGVKQRENMSAKIINQHYLSFHVVDSNSVTRWNHAKKQSSLMA